MKHAYKITVTKTVVLEADEPEPELNNPEVNRTDAFEMFKDAVIEDSTDSTGVTIEEVAP
jgi:hypothetical protein